MSRCYEITISVTQHDQDKCEQIVEAVRGEGLEADPDSDGEAGIIFHSEVINVNIGHTDQETARDVVEAIWEANGAWCQVNVSMRDLDADTPVHSWDETEYAEWRQMKAAQPAPSRNPPEPPRNPHIRIDC